MSKTEDLLREEIIFRRFLIEGSRDGIVTLDQNGKVHETNKRYADMLGYTVEEILQLHVWDWDTQFSKETLLQMIKTVDTTGDHFETRSRRKDGTCIDVEISTNPAMYRGQKLIFCICRDITEKKQAAQERENLIEELQSALTEIKALRGILPICSYCKEIRDDKGYWVRLEQYIEQHSYAEFSHSICDKCLNEKFPEEEDDEDVG